MKGYKAFNKDMTCKGFQYEVGKTYKHDGDFAPCNSGFHFCKSIADCYNFYPMKEDTIICKIDALGEVKTDDEIKFCTNEIKILSKIRNPKIKSNTNNSCSGYCNSGNWNSGNRNSGDRNSGDRNSGNRNSGDRNSGYWNSGNRNSGNRNSGDRNSGDRNSGYRNSGDWNSGYCNSGDWNSGDWNSGDWNSGDWNSGNRNSGCFCTNTNPKIKLFDAESDWNIEDWYNSKAKQVLDTCPFTSSDFICEGMMDADEKERHPEYKTIGGYIKTIIATKDDKQSWWDNLPQHDKEIVKSLPNFNADKFCQCVGLYHV